MGRLAVLLSSGVLAALAICCGSADASYGVATTLVNDTSYPIQLRWTGDLGCWNADALASPYTTVAAHSSSLLYSSIKDKGGSCQYTGEGGTTNAWIYTGLFFEQPDGVWTEPISGGQDNLNTSLFSSGLYAPRLYYDVDHLKAYWSNMPSGSYWFPASPITAGSTGDGLFCVNVSYPDGEVQGPPNDQYHQTVTIEPDQSCSSSTAAASAVTAAHSARDRARRRARAQRSPSARAPHARRRSDPIASTASATGVFDLEQLFQGACELLDPFSQCSTLTNSSLWNLNNITSDVASITATGSPSTGYGWGSLNPAYLEFQNTTDEPGSASYSFTAEEGEKDTTSTTQGMTIGNTITFGSVASPVNDSVSLGFNFSSTSADETNTDTSTTVNSTVTTAPDSTTYLYGFQGTASQEFDYNADLTFGSQSGSAEPLSTPVPAVFGYSPAQAQPCIGYLVGNASVTGSLTQLYDEALADGYTASDPNLNSEEIAFLSAGPSLTSSSAACPGFPSSSSSSSPNFASGAGFDGSGTATLSALGGGSESSWDPNLQGIVTCAYATTVSGSSDNPDNPCLAESATGSTASAADSGAAVRDAGAVVFARDYPRASRVIGPDRSVLMIGGNDDHDTLITGNGTFNIIRGGRGETLIARGKNDVLFGGPGRSRLFAGSGFDTLYAGSGNDLLSATAGHGMLRGGSGADTFDIGPHARYLALGGSARNTFNVHGSLAQLVGGDGRNTFRLLGTGGIPNIVVPTRGKGTLLTDRSLTVPQNIQVARAIGRRAVTLRAVRTTRELIGGAGPTRLVAGPGSERLIAGSGNTRFVFDRSGRATATGGRGRDTFVLAGVPLQTRGAGPAARGGSADRIVDFNPTRDQLVLRARVLGSRLLSDRLTMVEGSRPQPAERVPTLLFDAAHGVLSFDPDGTGPADRHVVVSISGMRCVRGRLAHTGKFRIRALHGTGCLSPRSIKISH